MSCLEEERKFIPTYQRCCRNNCNLLKHLFLLALYVTPCRCNSYHQCDLQMKNYTFEYKYSQEGDIIIGGIFAVNSAVSWWHNGEGKFFNFMCSAVNQREYRHLLAFIFAIDEINSSPDILPNVTLGYHVYDSCGSVNKATKDVLQILSGLSQTAPNYSCMERGTVAGFIGDLKSDTTVQMAQLLNLYGYAQISYGARDTLLSDRKMFPNLFRTVPDNEMQYVAIVKLMKSLKWNWVGIITSDDEYGEREFQQLSKQLTNHGICIEFKIMVSMKNYKIIPPDLQTSTTEILIICGSISRTYYNFLMRTVPYHMDKTFIIPDSWSMSEDLFHISNCSLVFSSPHPSIKKLEEYFNRVTLLSHPDDPILEDILILEHRCFSRHPEKNFMIPFTFSYPVHNCTLENIQFDLSHPDEKTSSRVFLAVNIMAQALHDIYFSLQIKDKEAKEKLSNLVYKVSHYVNSIHYMDPHNKEIYFKEKGDLPDPLAILNWITQAEVSNVTYWRHVGRFDGSLPEDQQLTLIPQLISWKRNQTPRGRCSAECLPGFRKALQEGYHTCCYDCVPCSEGEISIFSDSENCQMCPEDQWPNDVRNTCVAKLHEYLSYEKDVVVAFFSGSSLIFSATSLCILGIFFWFRNTPIVRANNRNFSFILLFSLILSFISVFLFLGHPMNITCMLQQIFFGIAFTVSLSSILAKTIMVFIAFKATKPGSSFRKWVGVKLPKIVLLLCSSIQVLSGIFWLSISPPFQEYDMHSFPGKIIIQCNEGSVIGFYSMLGYLGFLAAVSFVLAFMVRALPDNFNEAKYITFSMLMFCSVWIAMIPAYLSTKGKYTVAVEIFAILTSSAGILFCIFFPKLYILFFKPELNTRKSMLTGSIV